MKVSVCAKVIYQYEVEIPDNSDDIEVWADTLDPVYSRISKILADAGLVYDGSFVSIVDANTDEVYYLGD